MKSQTEIDPNLPVNKSANFVVSKSNESCTNFHPGDMLTSSIMLPTRNVPHNVPNYTGLKKGRLIVVGLSDSFRKGNGKGLRWVVRCSCGRHEIRTSRILKKGNQSDMCNVCKSTAFKKYTTKTVLL